MSRKRKSNGKRETESLVDRAAALFRTAGYTVTPASDLTNTEFSFIAEKSELQSIPIRVAVRCEAVLADALGEEALAAFKAGFDRWRSELRSSYALLVSGAGFSPGALAAAATEEALRLLTLQDLESELLGTTAYIKGAMRVYKSQAVREFIDLAADVQSYAGGKSVSIENLAAYLLEKIPGGTTTAHFILGDFGSGKTTLAERLHRSLGEAYLKGSCDLFPMIFYLRTLAQFDTDSSFVASQTRAVVPTAPGDLLRQMHARGRVLLILDGFDEIATHSTEQERFSYFARVLQIAQSCSHLVLTSRPSYFSNIGEFNDLVDILVDRNFKPPHSLTKQVRRADQERQLAVEHNLSVVVQKVVGEEFRRFPAAATRVVTLRPMSEEKIIAFMLPYAAEIRRKHRKTPKEVYDVLRGVYDLSDIITRPLLLEMFIEVLLKGKIDLNDPDLLVGPVGLYELYVNLHLYREARKTQFLTPEARLSFARAAAVAMLQGGGFLEATYASIESIVRSGGEIFQALGVESLERDMERVVTDVRVCAFVNVTPSNRIEFSHKSFMEFFVADLINEKLASGKYVPELALELNYEILYFLGGFGLLRQDSRIQLVKHLRDVAYRESSRYRTNVQIAILFSERTSTGRTFSDLEYEAIKVSKKEFNNCKFSAMVLSKAELSGCGFSDCEFNDVQFYGDMTKAMFTRCVGDVVFPLTVYDLNISSSRLGLLNLQEVEGGAWAWSQVGFDAKTLSLNKCTIEQTTLELEGLDALTLTGCTFQGVRLLRDWQGTSPPLHLLASKTKFMDSAILGVKITRDIFYRLDENNFLRGLTGVLVVEDEAKTIQQLYDHVRRGEEKVSVYRGWMWIDDLLVIGTPLARKVSQGFANLRSMLEVDASRAKVERWKEARNSEFEGFTTP